jgi:hypothetical protein
VRTRALALALDLALFRSPPPGSQRVTSYRRSACAWTSAQSCEEGGT